MLPELKAQFMLFLGDFIYVDVPERFGKSTEEYRMQYRQIYASPDWATVGQNLSWIHVLDDHEISNDWSSNTTGVYKAAVEPWHLYHAQVNPPAVKRDGSDATVQLKPTWFEFVQGPASFFMLDTRSYRSSNDQPFNDSAKTMLGKEQLDDFLAWLARPEPPGVKWKFVASSVPFTKNWPVNVKDTWGGFLVERKEILESMWAAGSQGTTVVILSGDRHEFAATKFPPPPDSKWPEASSAYEFSTSPLNQFASPYPTYKQQDDEDVMLRYIPAGTSKFGAFTIQNIAGKSTLDYRLFIDGQETWSTRIFEAPAPEKPTILSTKLSSSKRPDPSWPEAPQRTKPRKPSSTQRSRPRPDDTLGAEEEGFGKGRVKDVLLATNKVDGEPSVSTAEVLRRERNLRTWQSEASSNVQCRAGGADQGHRG
ncbi:alkaline phosphatase family protein [Ophiocordyceps camponoti-floridani]|uniref:Alkaline phosphatase family protein n=1 Tax=Ophiocordyceps camponoti-floridani TaxID=2030778 RepID=A0A8H4Q0H7_9HYPO|nr:alkaline phosphatase family protein [Ophiocordyceps camponoti-floridani]